MDKIPWILPLLFCTTYIVAGENECVRKAEGLFGASVKALQRVYLLLEERRAQSSVLLENPLKLEDVENDVEKLLRAGANPNINSFWKRCHRALR